MINNFHYSYHLLYNRIYLTIFCKYEDDFKLKPVKNLGIKKTFAKSPLFLSTINWVNQKTLLKQILIYDDIFVNCIHYTIYNLNFIFYVS